MKAINTPTSKALRIFDNIMEGYTEWFTKDEHHSASLEFSRIGGDYEIITAKFYGTGVKVRKLHIYDSWNGSSCNITIEEAEQGTDSVHFTGTNSYGGKSGIYVDNELLPTLIKTGKAERSQEIEHCDVKIIWNLN